MKIEIYLVEKLFTIKWYIQFNMVNVYTYNKIIINNVIDTSQDLRIKYVHRL